MPSFAVHFQIAAALAGEGLDGSTPAPDGDAVRAAFLHGSLAPDMGYYPGGWRLLSDLAHYVRSGQLVRRLLRHASSDVERAFAWGWASHVIADVAIHPLVNAGSGALVHGDRARPLTFADDPAAHLRVEVGLDAVLYLRRSGAQRVVLRPLFQPGDMGFVAAAFRDTYGVDFDLRRVQASHRAVARLQRFQALLDGVAGARHLGRPVASRLLPFYVLLYLPARAVTALTPRSNVVRALFHTAQPPPWLVEDVEAAYGKAVEDYAAHRRTGLEELPDFNLDTGEVEPETPTYALTELTLASLERHRQG